MAAFVAKIVAQDATEGALLAVVAWAALVAAVVIVGVISESTALQRFAATRVAPTVLVMQIVIPVVMAPLVGGEGWSNTPLGGAVLVMALVAVAAGRRPAGELAGRRPARRRRGRGRLTAGGRQLGRTTRPAVPLAASGADECVPELLARSRDLRQTEAAVGLVVDPHVPEPHP